MARIEISTTEFEFAHGRKPRGVGCWAFRLQGDLATHFFPESSFAVAKQAALALARKNGATRISVCS